MARARDRSLGVVYMEHIQKQHKSSSITSSHGKKRSQRDWDSRSCIVVNSMTSKQIHHEEEDDDGAYSLYTTKGSSSLVDWLSEPLSKTTNEMKDNTQDIIKEVESKASPVCTGVDKASVSNNTTTKEKIGKSEEYEDDIEDGFIGL